MKRVEEEYVQSAPVHIDPSLATHPVALRYAQRLAATKQGSAPRAGGECPPIPRLDGPPIEGITMAQQALQEQANQRLIQQQQQQYMMQPQQVAQPFEPPHAHAGSNPPRMLKPETVAGLNAIASFENQQHAVSNSNTQEPGVGTEAKSEDEERKPMTNSEVEKAMQNMDDFDMEDLRNYLMKDILNNEDQREIVEARLEPMNLSEIIEKGYLTQKVPIVPGVWEPTFQSLSAQDELGLRRLLMEELKSVGRTNAYIDVKYSIMSTVIGLYAVNKKVMPSHRDAEGNFNDELFWRKFNLIQKFAFQMLASASVHFHYFDVRVRSLFKAIKNG